MLLQRIRQQKQLFILFLIFFIIGILFIVMNSLEESFIQLNFFHHPYLDTFFINYTLLGDGVFTITLCLILLLYERFTLAIQLILAYLSSGIVVQILKQLIQAPRPKVVFSETEYTYFFDGLTRSGLSSFPSGHTASAFALATLLALHTKNKYLKLLYLFLSIIIGYSRIYLGHHFPIDVLAGAFIGLLSSVAIHWLLKEAKVCWMTNNNHFRILIH